MTEKHSVVPEQNTELLVEQVVEALQGQGGQELVPLSPVQDPT
ncbi:MAG TPA: hypothetical protein VIA62_04170 [Thermoanaerobaculia bacterium]|nr:hypothetical protein [Thermoanaerobaculia bacterium]